MACQTTGLCPLSLSAVVNGVYYYNCSNCLNGNLIGKTGGQDTRAHTVGVNCQCILDPITIPAPARVEGKPVKNHEVVCFDLALSEGLHKPIDFDDTKFEIYPADGVSFRFLQDGNYVKASYPSLSGRKVTARLFHILGPGGTYRAGQELAEVASRNLPKGLIPDPDVNGPDRDPDNQEDDKNKYNHHRIWIRDPDTKEFALYHILATPLKGAQRQG
jgi:hypothetical protein